MNNSPSILLILQDETQGQKIVSELLARRYSFTSFSDPKQAAESIPAGEYNAAVIHLPAPEGQPLKTVRSIRRKKHWLPIVCAVEAEAGIEKSLLLKAGADAVYFLPEEFAAFFESINFYVSMSRQIKKNPKRGAGKKTGNTASAEKTKGSVADENREP